jgi:putative transposase
MDASRGQFADHLPDQAQLTTRNNALAETTVGSFKNELIRRQGPWRDVNHVEIATAEWVLWFNTERPHEYLDDFTPEAVEKLHYDHRRTPPKAG